MKGTGWGQKNLFPSTPRRSLYCRRTVLVPVCCCHKLFGTGHALAFQPQGRAVPVVLSKSVSKDVGHTVKVPIERNVVIDVDGGARPLAHVETFTRQRRRFSNNQKKRQLWQFKK